MVEQVVTGEIEGGAKLEKYLRGLAMRLGSGATAKIGFLEGATYPAEAKGMLKSGKISTLGGKKATAARREKLENLASSSGPALNVATVAFWNEFGTLNEDGSERTPPRAFFRNMVEDQMATWPKKLGMAARYSGYRSKQTLEIVAADIKSHLVESINLFNDPPNSSRTVEEKGFNKPLIDTGVMLRAPSWEIDEGKPVKE